MTGKFNIPIKHRDWLLHSDPGKSIELFKIGRLPKAIDGWMIVVGCKHPLRAVYGSDLRAGLALTFWALKDKLEAGWERVARILYSVPFAYAWLWTAIASKFQEFPGWGRRESPEPIRCLCGWAGMRRWAIHGYQDDGSGEDVEPADECPRCGDEV